MYSIKIYTGDEMEWNDLALDRERWRALLNAVRNLELHKMPGIS